MSNRGLKFRVGLPDDNESDDADKTRGAPLQTGSLFQRLREQKKVGDSTNNKTCTIKTTDVTPTRAASCNSERYAKPDVNVSTKSNSKVSDQSGSSKQGEHSAKEATAMRTGATFTESFSYLKDTIHYESPPDQVNKVGNEDTAQKYRSNSIIVNPRQRGNPILKHVKNVPWEYGDVIPDYVLGQTQCAIFLSLRYYNFNQEYIHERLKQLGNRFDLRILLVLVDIKDCKHALKELGKIAILSECTLILSWSPEEAGRYLETYKAYENKPPDVIQERVDGDYLSKMTDCLTSVKSVNKTDVITLLSAFGSLERITHASKDELALCPGFGHQKAERLHRLFREPFKKRMRKSDHSKKDEKL